MARPLHLCFADVVVWKIREDGGTTMNFTVKTTKVFAYFLLFFVNVLSASAQTGSAYDIEAGTKILVQMDNEINSRASSVNDTFTATLAEPLLVRETIVLPVGTVVEGKITNVERASVGGKNGKIIVSFQTLRLPNGTKRSIEGVLVKELEAVKSSSKVKALTVVGATAVGGIIGAISKASNGTLIGAGVGAGAGTGFALLQKGKDARIRADEKFEIKLTKNVTLPAQDY